MMRRASTALRAHLSFSSVNRPGSKDYQAGLQRHHLLPRQLLGQACFAAMFEKLDQRAIGFDDFRSNGLLLPADESASVRLGLPLHRGPHRQYNELVAERVGQIEEGWSSAARKDGARALEEALMRLALLQAALRRRLLEGRIRPIRLNRSDTLGAGRDFSHLDAMAEQMWSATEISAQSGFSFRSEGELPPLDAGPVRRC